MPFGLSLSSLITLFILSSRSFTSILKVSGSISTKTGVALKSLITSAVAIKCKSSGF